MSCVARGRYCACEGRVQEHHAIPQQRIKRAHKALEAEHRRGGPKPPPITRILRDPRNLVRICKRHHELVTGSLIALLHAEDLPAGVWAFADELDWLCGENGARPFRATLERDYPSRRVA